LHGLDTVAADTDGKVH
jgi:hypothetical protein